MTPAECEEAAAVAGALIGCVIDGDAEGAAVLLTHTSHQVIAQACTDLARWIVACADDAAELRADLAEQLRRFGAR